MKNRGVIYTGRIGAKLRPRRAKSAAARRVFQYKQWRLFGGPLGGSLIKLDATGDGRTLPIVCKGMAGHYKAGHWVGAGQA